jgi:hypothetical protein
MARGWGRSEEDLAADKEQAREERGAASNMRPDREKIARRRTFELTLARIEEQLARTTHPARREALETAREELLERLGQNL